MTREQAIAAYRRVYEWERRQSGRLRDEILVPVFGGSLCRMHNCKVNWESGLIETADPRKHQEQVKLAKLYEHKQAMIWEKSNCLQASFARHF